MTTPATINTTFRRRRGMTEEAANAAIDGACRRLRLPTIRAVVDEATAAAEKEQLSYQGFLAELLLAECDDRDRRSSVRRVKAAGFPRDKWLGDFDFDENPNVAWPTGRTCPSCCGSASAGARGPCWTSTSAARWPQRYDPGCAGSPQLPAGCPRHPKARRTGNA